MLEAALEAHRLTRDPRWMRAAQKCFNWFLGKNDLQQSLIDPRTGGCRDGLHSDSVNQNQGAESTIAWLMSLLLMYEEQGDMQLERPPAENPKAESGKKQSGEISKAAAPPAPVPTP
jgi:hypothetical protein